MGQSDSKKKIEEEFEIYKLEDNGNALLRSKVDDKDYLMRVVSCTHQSDLQRLKTLLQSRAQIKNPHLLSLVQIKEKQQDFICSIQYKMYLVLQYSFKNTAEEIKERTKNHMVLPFQESQLWSILYSCCTGLQGLVSNGISHQCLTASQIFINKDGFIKISEPLLFGLEKNHLQAMRTKQNGTVEVHLSPEIMNCIEDQNFFYYEKEKSDIFILAMIVVDLALLKTHYLYDVAKRRPQLELIPELLNQVRGRYSQNLVSILSEMLKIESKSRPNLSQIVQRVEKCNNIGQDFTLETESNLKSNDASSEKEQERFVFQKPAKYRELQIKQDSSLDQSQRPKVIQQKVMVRAPEQASLSINQQGTSFNQHNFQGRVFASTPHQSSYTTQTQAYTHNYTHTQQIHSSLHQRNASSIPIAQNNQPSYRQPSQPSFSQSNQPSYTRPSFNKPVKPIQNQPSQSSQPVHFQGFKKQFDLYERSRSIDSIKVGSNQFSKIEYSKHPFSATKVSPFNTIEEKGLPQLPQQKRQPFHKQQMIKKTHQPLFTHEIPEVYNIMIKNTKTPPKTQFFSNEEKNVILDKEHVSTPQFNGQITKVNRFTSFKPYPHETVSRVSDEGDLSGLNTIQMLKKISHAQSQTFKGELPKNLELDSLARQTRSPDAFPTNASFAPQQSINNFVKPIPFMMQNQRPPLSTSAAGHSPGPKPSLQYGSTVSQNFTPTKSQFGRRSESKTCRSGFEHQADQPDPNLEYIKEQIPERGRYEGYKLYDQRSGHGSLFFKDGGHYEGEWKNDKMHGFGKLYYQNGAIAYEGHWQNDQFNGQGRVYNMESVSFTEEFNYRDFSQLSNKWTYYDGHFKNDSKHGKGYIKLTNGEMFEGIFDHDMIEGNGIFYKRSGQIIIGFWIDNKLFLNQSYQNQKK